MMIRSLIRDAMSTYRNRYAELRGCGAGRTRSVAVGVLCAVSGVTALAAMWLINTRKTEAYVAEHWPDLGGEA